MKTCTKCGHTKPLEDYHREGAAKDGRRADCRDCAAARNKSRIRVRRVAAEAETPGAGCNWPGCRRAAALEGLCDTHHEDVANTRESPLVLTGGQWVKSAHGVRRWVA